MTFTTAQHEIDQVHDFLVYLKIFNAVIFRPMTRNVKQIFAYKTLFKLNSHLTQLR